MRIYFAASLFTRAERKWNRSLSEAMKEAMPGLEVTLPQDFATGKEEDEDKHHGLLFRMCVEAIDAAEAVVAMIDGDEVDSGTAWEMGYAYAREMPVIGVRTDFRPGAELGVNVMLSRSCCHLVRELSFQDDVTQLAKDIVRRLGNIDQFKKDA